MGLFQGKLDPALTQMDLGQGIPYPPKAHGSFALQAVSAAASEMPLHQVRYWEEAHARFSTVARSAHSDLSGIDLKTSLWYL